MRPDQIKKYKEIDVGTAQALWDSGCSIEWEYDWMLDWNLCKYDEALKVDWDRWFRARLADGKNPRMRVAVE